MYTMQPGRSLFGSFLRVLLSSPPPIVKLQVCSSSMPRNAPGGGVARRYRPLSRADYLTPPLAGVSVKDVKEEQVPQYYFLTRKHGTATQRGTRHFPYAYVCRCKRHSFMDVEEG
ncbi:hypothetical protein NLU13_8883 [Sarocladium strictum]|uniref:Uncharacterized protein n=1 Tax=Sarocladium strictum TaxID=5046 RepID=A0AA39L3P2_SARSR|nr:hypothetical protein NLU13_8883 [Sarocladium strictum]